MKRLLGNKNTAEMLDGIIAGKALSHAYLFVGPSKIGKTEQAKNFGQKLLCEKGTGCGECLQCKLIAAGNHPDFIVNDSSETVGVDEIRGLIHFLELKPYQAQKKVAIIANAERLTEQASNSLLKTLEEPAQNTIIIQTAERSKNLLDTIVSRSQLVSFNALASTDINELLIDFNLDQAISADIAKISSGKPGLAVSLAENEDKREEFFNIIRKFDEVIETGRIYEKLNFASELASKKENIIEILNLIESHWRNKLLEDGNNLKIVVILDKLTETKELINRNINLQLALESLMLAGE